MKMHENFGKIQDVFDPVGQLDSISPSVRSNPTTRRGRKHLHLCQNFIFSCHFDRLKVQFGSPMLPAGADGVVVVGAGGVVVVGAKGVVVVAGGVVVVGEDVVDSS